MTNPPPQFRPRRSKTPADSRRRWIRYGALTGAAALIVALAAVLLVMFLDDDEGGEAAGPEETPTAESTAGSADNREPVSEGVVQYVVQLDDLTPGFQVDTRETYVISPTGFASGPIFPTVSQGEAAADDWGYIDGYQALLEPVGKSADVALGKHYVRTEVYRFETVEGARAAYDYMERFHTQIGGSVTVPTNPLGNQSSAFRIVSAAVPGTELPAAYHRFIARRGNLVYAAQVYGAQQFTSMSQARDYAAIIDMKITGDLEAPLPTPTPVNSGVGAAPTIPTAETPTPAP